MPRAPLPRLRRVEPALRLALRNPRVVPRGSGVIVAASGGADSTALLVAIASLAREFALRPTAAHLHHGLRGADADADAAHVAALCRRLGVPFVLGRRRGGPAGETRLRATRRGFLVRVAARHGAARVLTAHTADDQLETMLHRLARGSGLRGLGGMAPRRGAFAKPLLGVTRAAIEADLARAGVAWREDASNRTANTPRNVIRREVVPALERALRTHGGVTGALAARAARLAAEVRAADAALAARARARLARRATDPRRLPRAACAGPPAARRAMARAFWRRAAGPVPLLARHVDAFLEAMSGGPDRVWTLPRGWRLARTADSLRLLRDDSPGTPAGRSRRSARARIPL